MYQNCHSHRRLRAKKESQVTGLTNVAVKWKSALVAWKSSAGRAGDLALLHGYDVELLGPLAYRVRCTRRNSVPIKGTKFRKPGAGGMRLFLCHYCRRSGRYP